MAGLKVYKTRNIKITAIQFEPRRRWPKGMEHYVPIIRSNCQKCGLDCNEHGIMGKDIYCPGDYIVQFMDVKFPVDEHTFRLLFMEDKT